MKTNNHELARVWHKRAVEIVLTHKGRAAAINSRELAKQLNAELTPEKPISADPVRQYLTTVTAPIVHSADGFYTPQTVAEIAAAIDDLRARITAHESRIAFYLELIKKTLTA